MNTRALECAHKESSGVPQSYLEVPQLVIRVLFV